MIIICDKVANVGMLLMLLVTEVCGFPILWHLSLQKTLRKQINQSIPRLLMLKYVFISMGYCGLYNTGTKIDTEPLSIRRVKIPVHDLQTSRNIYFIIHVCALLITVIYFHKDNILGSCFCSLFHKFGQKITLQVGFVNCRTLTPVPTPFRSSRNVSCP